jgi:DNA mismatch repair protein MutL
MSRPETGFEVISGGKILLNYPRRDNLHDRLCDIFPSTELLGIYAEDEGVKISGFMSSPLDTRSTTHKLFTYINKRAVRDKFLTRITIDAYGKMLEKRKFPQGALFIDMPASEVDVNVHPTKNEVRFRNQRLIADLIRTAILKMLREAPWIKSYKGRVESAVSDFMESGRGQASYRDVQHTTGTKRSFFEEVHEIVSSGEKNSYSTHKELTTPKHLGHEYRMPPDESPKAGLFGNAGLYSSLKIIGQIKELYIVCASESGMVLVDQHAAHERINYEKLKRAYLEKKALEVQELLVPEVVEFPPYEANLIKRHLEDFESLGLRMEDFGNNSFIVRSVPAILKNADSAALVKDVISEIAAGGKEESVSEKIDLVIATMACHSSIKAKFELSGEEMKALLKELDEMEFPHSCPHGRPVAQELSYYAIERMFKRS